MAGSRDHHVFMSKARHYLKSTIVRETLNLSVCESCATNFCYQVGLKLKISSLSNETHISHTHLGTKTKTYVYTITSVKFNILNGLASLKRSNDVKLLTTLGRFFSTKSVNY